MYGYGLEGYGYRYPPIEGYYDEPIVLGTIQKGRLKGKPIKRYPRKVDEKWVAAYLLNKLTGKENKWREIATKYLQAARQEYQKYLETLRNSPKKEDREAYVKAVLNRQRKEARKGQLPLALRTPEGKKLYEDLLQFKDNKPKLLEIYYKGKKIPKPRPIPEEVIQEILGEQPKKV
jgi:hypothetical protein